MWLLKAGGCLIQFKYISLWISGQLSSGCLIQVGCLIEVTTNTALTVSWNLLGKRELADLLFFGLWFVFCLSRFVGSSSWCHSYAMFYDYHYSWTACARFCLSVKQGSHSVTKRTFWHVHSTKNQISLRICAIWSVIVVRIKKNFASLVIQNVPSEDSDQTARMRSLIWIFAGLSCPKVRFLTFRIK